MLTAKTSYEMVYIFLEAVYIQHKDEYTYDFPILLSDMKILADGTTADPAQEHDWKLLLPNKEVTLDKVFEIMLTFLAAYGQRGDTGEIAHLVDGLKHLEYRQLWDNHVQHFMSEIME